MPQISINITIASFMLIISTKIIETIEKTIIRRDLKIHCLLGTLRLLLRAFTPVRIDKNPEIAIKTALAIIKNFGASIVFEVVVKISTHVIRQIIPEIANIMLAIIKNNDFFCSIRQIINILDLKSHQNMIY